VDKVLSARLEESVIDELDRACKRLGTTKKQFLEEAIRQRAAAVRGATGDVWDDTSGAWVRREAPETTIRRARRTFESAMARHRRPAEVPKKRRR
jgi:Ribbon-helix-helix protein, copG family